jgi:hypothetical protein
MGFNVAPPLADLVIDTKHEAISMTKHQDVAVGGGGSGAISGSGNVTAAEGVGLVGGAGTDAGRYTKKGNVGSCGISHPSAGSVGARQIRRNPKQLVVKPPEATEPPSEKVMGDIADPGPFEWLCVEIGSKLRHLR